MVVVEFHPPRSTFFPQPVVEHGDTELLLSFYGLITPRVTVSRLHLYVMLSRATSANDLLVLRAPPMSFLTQGPPADLAARLRTFRARTQACRVAAERLARDLGFTPFLHG